MSYYSTLNNLSKEFHQSKKKYGLSGASFMFLNRFGGVYLRFQTFLVLFVLA